MHRARVRSGAAAWLVALAGVCACAGAPSAWAERADRQQPMRLEADHLQHDEPRQQTVFSGHVQAVKGSLVMRAGRMEVQQTPAGHHTARLSAASGERIFFRQKREGLDEFIEGFARQAVYSSQADEMTLREQAEVRIVRQGQTTNRIEGQSIVYNSYTETLTVDGAPQGEGRARVRAVLSPPADGPAAPTPVLRPSPGVRP